MPRHSWKLQGPGLALLLLSATVVAAQTPEELDRQVIWADAEQTQALFLPETLLRDSRLDLLPLTKSDRLYLRKLIGTVPAGRESREHFQKHWRERRGEALPVCEVPRPSHEDGPAVDPQKTLEAKAREADVTFLASVVGLVPAWNTSSRRVETLIYLQIEATLFSQPGQRKWEGVVALAEIGGEIRFSGHHLCTTSRARTALPALGDHFLVIADAFPPDDRYVFGYSFLAVHDGVFAETEPSSFPGGQTRDLEAFIAAVQREEVQP